MILGRAVDVPDPLARANVVAAFSGPGAPAGVLSCVVEGATVALTFESDRTSGNLIDALVAVETTFVPQRAPALHDWAEAASIAARGLAEPDLDATRIIETYLP